MAVKLEDMDFLVDEIDDVTLSQVCESIESEHLITGGLCDLSITQMVQKYEIDSGIDYSADDDVLGDFLLNFPIDQENTSTEMPMETENNDDTERFIK